MRPLKKKTVHPSSTGTVQAAHDRYGSSPAHPRHTNLPAYRCFLPDLAGFTGVRCVGPSLLHRMVAPALRDGASDEHRPRYSGLRVQGTATSPSSTAHPRGRQHPALPRSLRPTHSNRDAYGPHTQGSGGRGGIRTLGGFRLTRSPGVPDQPLLHPSPHQTTDPPSMAEGGGFEPPVPFGTQHFECCTFNRSDTPPRHRNPGADAASRERSPEAGPRSVPPSARAPRAADG